MGVVTLSETLYIQSASIEATILSRKIMKKSKKSHTAATPSPYGPEPCPTSITSSSRGRSGCSCRLEQIPLARFRPRR